MSGRKVKPITAFAAVQELGRSQTVMPWSVCHTAEQVRIRVGNNWDQSDYKNGWKLARKSGHRIIKVKISEVLS